MSELAQDLGAQLADLRLAGADQYDPVTWHYLQGLFERAARHRGEVRRLLDARLAQALQTLRERFAQAQREARQAATSPPRSAPRASLGELARALSQPAPETRDGGRDAGSSRVVGNRPELKSVRHFRNTWSKLSVDKQLAKALGRAPKNAGPINSHSLVLRSLALMRELSPDYLNRFMCYADALLCLDQGDQARPAPVKKLPRAKAVKK
jgi:AcrR family transcriptional regulator